MPAHPTLKSLLRHLNGYDAIPYYISNLVAGGGFEPPKLSRQIYSLIPLAARESPPKNGRLFSLSRGSLSTNKRIQRKNGAGERSRTPDRLITSQLLYQLSYASISNAERDFRETRDYYQP